MTRKLKALGLALAATFVFGATLASAAQAETGIWTTQQYPAFVTAQKINAVPLLDIGPRQISCNTVDFNATIVGPVDPITFNSTLDGCVGNGGTAVTVTMNGCDFTFGVTRPGSTGDPATTGKLTTGIDCPAGQQIEIHVYATAANHAANVSLCTWDIAPQGPVPAGIYHNVVGFPNDVEMTVEANLAAVRTVGTAVNCGAANPATKLTGVYTARAFFDNNGVEGALQPLDIG